MKMCPTVMTWMSTQARRITALAAIAAVGLATGCSMNQPTASLDGESHVVLLTGSPIVAEQALAAADVNALDQWLAQSLAQIEQVRIAAEAKERNILGNQIGIVRVDVTTLDQADRETLACVALDRQRADAQQQVVETIYAQQCARFADPQ